MLKNLTRDEFIQKLKTDFPNLYRNRCEVSIDKGWRDLVYNLSEKLEKEILNLPEEERYKHYAQQVKEKFRGLRFYISKYDFSKNSAQFIQEAEELSYKTCELCGSLEGEEYAPKYWIRTICHKCQTIKEIIE
jgi:hypothetical protein